MSRAPTGSSSSSSSSSEVIYLFETRRFLLGKVDGLEDPPAVRGVQPRSRPRRGDPLARPRDHRRRQGRHLPRAEDRGGATASPSRSSSTCEPSHGPPQDRRQHLGDPGPGRHEGPGRRLCLRPAPRDIRRDQTLVQARNVACLPGIERRSYVMPDAHQGYGFPIGGVAAFDLDEGDHLAGRRRLRHQLRRPPPPHGLSRRRTSRPRARSFWPRSSRRSRPEWGRAASPSSAGPSSGTS